jgi:hypothetical protein
MPIVGRLGNRNVQRFHIQYLKVNLRPLGRFDIQNARNYITVRDWTGKGSEDKS